jgi:uncharacterized protein YegP (UPF0339 family)
VGTLVRCLVLAAAMGGLVVAGGAGTATAVQKDKGKDTKKAEAKAAGTVELFEDKAGKFRFRIKDEDGKVVADSTKGYEKKEEALKALDFVKTTLNTAKVTEVKK